MNVGDRILLRDRPWRIRTVGRGGNDHLILEVEALDRDLPRTLSVVTPLEVPTPLPNEEVRFEPKGLESFAAWSNAHRLLSATLIRETGLLTGARFGRVALEAYQLAPALRLLAKPRPSLLVADDVGLGKTIEAGLALLELMARGRADRTLVVTPPGLMDQWQEELLEKFGLDFTILENAAGMARVQSNLPAGVNAWDALPRIITSLDFIKKETVRHRALRKRWDLVIVDEAHALAESGTPENPYRAAGPAARRLRRPGASPARCRPRPHPRAPPRPAEARHGAGGRTRPRFDPPRSLHPRARHLGREPPAIERAPPHLAPHALRGDGHRGEHAPSAVREYAPYLDYRPLSEGEPAVAELLVRRECAWITHASGQSIEQRAQSHAIAHVVPEHIAEVRGRRLAWIKKTHELRRYPGRRHARPRHPDGGRAAAPKPAAVVGVDASCCE